MIWTKSQLTKSDCVNTKITIGSDDILNTNSVRYLGFHLGCKLKNKTHVNKLTSTLYTTIKHISSIHHCLDEETTKVLVQALVLSKLDYCNSMLVGSEQYHIDKLQWIMNMACRVIFRLTKYEHISPYMQKLNWLKVNERITYTLATFVYQCVKGDAPKYLSDILAMTHGHNLKTSTFNKLPISRSNIAQVHNGSFKSVGASIWNNLPNDITGCTTLEAFKRKLKTHLFRLSYNLT